MDEMTIGVIGCGARGRRHIECLEGFADVQVGAICDPAEKNLEVAGELSMKASRCTSLDEFAKVKLDAVIIAVPAQLNSRIAGQVLQFGLPTLLEKPPGLTLHETQALLDIAKRSRARCMVGLNRRYHPMIIEAISAVRARGPIVQIVAEFHKSMDRQLAAQVVPLADLARWPNALLLESPIHAIDLTRHIAGAPVERVSCAARKAFHEYADVHAALVEFANGCLASLTFNYTGDERLERYEIHGKGISAYIENSLVAGTWVEIVADGQKVRTSRVTDSGLYNQNRAFVDGARQGAEYAAPAPSLEDALETMALAEAIGGPIAPSLPDTH